MSLLTDSVLQGSIFFIFLVNILSNLTNKNLVDVVSKAKRLIQYGLFMLIIILIYIKNHLLST